MYRHIWSILVVTSDWDYNVLQRLLKIFLRKFYVFFTITTCIKEQYTEVT